MLSLQGPCSAGNFGFMIDAFLKRFESSPVDRQRSVKESAFRSLSGDYFGIESQAPLTKVVCEIETDLAAS